MHRSSRFVLLATCCFAPTLTACFVPQNRHDETVAELRGERAERERTSAELAAVKERLARAEDSLRAREKALDDGQMAISQSKLDADRATTERDDAVMMVEQLRGELGRVGGHLKEFSDQKRELEAALSDAEARAKQLEAAERDIEVKVLLARDLSLTLGDAVSRKEAAIAVVAGRPVVRLDAKTVFSDAGELTPRGAELADRVAGVVARRAGARVELADLSAGEMTPEDRIVRLQHVADMFSEKGIGFERIGFAMPSTDSPDGAAPPKAAAEKAPPSSGMIEIRIETAAPAEAPDTRPSGAVAPLPRAKAAPSEAPVPVEKPAAPVPETAPTPKAPFVPPSPAHPPEKHDTDVETAPPVP